MAQLLQTMPEKMIENYILFQILLLSLDQKDWSSCVASFLYHSVFFVFAYEQQQKRPVHSNQSNESPETSDILSFDYPPAPPRITFDI